MRVLQLMISFLFLPVFIFGQTQPFEVFGTISGTYNSKIYFFYEGNYKKKDSISSEIKNGKFYFKARAPFPIQIRFHLDQQSYIRDIFIDSKKTFISCRNKIEIYGTGKDTMNIFTIANVKGSKAESLKQDFEDWLMKLNASNKSDEEKREAYYDKLHDLVTRHPRSKVSAYLIGKASALRYSQVNALRSLLDSTLKNSFEEKSITQLLNRLDKTKNKAIGTDFLNVTLKNNAGTPTGIRDFRGKYVLVDFWASWCKPCREMNPDLKELYVRLKDKSFEILGISFDKNESKWKEAIIKDGLPWMQLIDTKGFLGELGEHYDIESLPQNILIGKDGKIMGVTLSIEEIVAMIEKDLSAQ